MTGISQPVLGIDLGTTNSCVARVGEGSGKPIVIPNAESDLLTPSVVYFEAADNIIVGKIAKGHAIVYPEQVCSHIKREMSLEPEHVKELTYQGIRYSPEQISALILRKVVRDALDSEGFSEDLRAQAVITVPAYFGTIGKNATLQAGKLADIDVLYVAPEPVAAAIAYGFGQVTGTQRVLVYDLGGGTFDVTVVETDGKSAKVLAFDGERLLGGVDWDRDIINWFRGRISAEHGVDLPEDDLVLEQKLMKTAEEAKMALSRRKINNVVLAVESQGKTYSQELSVEEFEAMTAERLETTIEKTRAVMQSVESKGITKIDKLLVVGGSSRMPAVARRLQEATGLEPELRDPDQAIAKGAALLAAMIQRGEFRVDMTGDAEPPAPESRLVTMLTPKGLGLEAYDPKARRDVVRYLVPKNSEQPARASAVFGLYEDGQSHINIKIYEERGEESDNPAENTLLHETPIELPAGLQANSPIEVTFCVDDVGVLHVSLQEPTTRKTWEIHLDKFSNVGHADVLRLKPALESVV